MSIFVSATERLRAKLNKDGLPFADFREMIARRPAAATPGTAVYLTSDTGLGACRALFWRR